MDEKHVFIAINQKPISLKQVATITQANIIPAAVLAYFVDPQPSSLTPGHQDCLRMACSISRWPPKCVIPVLAMFGSGNALCLKDWLFCVGGEGGLDRGRKGMLHSHVIRVTQTGIPKEFLHVAPYPSQRHSSKHFEVITYTHLLSHIHICFTMGCYLGKNQSNDVSSVIRERGERDWGILLKVGRDRSPFSLKSLFFLIDWLTLCLLTSLLLLLQQRHCQNNDDALCFN